jgi:hypothetical protein
MAIEARLYGGGRWHALGPTLVVEDVQSLKVRSLLHHSEQVVASGHLGEAADQVRRVADALGLKLPSANVLVERRDTAPEPRYAPRLHELVDVLQLLENHTPLPRISFRTELAWHLGSDRHPISAYIEERELLLAGSPASFRTAVMTPMPHVRYKHAVLLL